MAGRHARSDSPFQASANSILGESPVKDELRATSPGRSSLRAPGTPSSGKRVAIGGQSTTRVPALEYTGSPTFKDPPVVRGEKTPRSGWRSQYWKKATPWATDRDAYGGNHQYLTTIKPTSCYYNDQHQWHVEGYDRPRADSAEDIIRQLIGKLEQHCRSTFLLTRMFKMFDKDNSNTIDKDEMVGVLLTFSIELTENQLESIMTHFGAVDRGKGHGREISYGQFVNAIEKIAKQHPLDSRTSRPGYIHRAIFSTSGDGQRLCTPGFHAPIGCPMHGSYYPEDSAMLNIHQDPPRFHTGANSPANVEKRRRNSILSDGGTAPTLEESIRMFREVSLPE